MMNNKPLLYSAVLHLVVLLVMIFGLPHLRSKPLDSQLVLVEFAPIGALTQTPRHKRSAPSQKKALQKVQPKVEPTPPTPTPPSATTPSAQAPTPPPPAQTPDATKKADVKPSDIVDPTPAKETKKPEEPKPPAAEKSKKPPTEQTAVVDNSKRKATKTDKEEPKKKPRPKDEFAKIIDSVAKLEGDLDATEDHNEEHGEKSTVADSLGPTLTISETDAVRRQLQACWHVPTGAKDAQALIVEIRVHANPDGTIRQAEVLNSNPDPFFRAAADSARRAVLNPKCSPLKLPPDKYSQWKVFTIRFDPRDMF